MQKNQKAPASVFYTPLEEVKTGYLYKSPPYRRLNTEKSWKRRFFALLGSTEQGYQLKYFKSAEDLDKPLGSIDLMQISVLFTRPKNHPKWAWVEKNMRCSPCCVLHIKALERDYFLMGESSQEVDQWFAGIHNLLKHRPHSFYNSEAKGTRSVSDPPPMRSKSFSEIDQRAAPPRRPRSEPLDPIYDYPKSYLLKLQNMEESKDKALGADSSYYMSMNDMCGRTGVMRENSSLMRSVTQVYDKMRTQPPTVPEEAPEKRETLLEPPPKAGTASRENGKVSPAEMLTRGMLRLPQRSLIKENLDLTPVRWSQKDIEIDLADVVKYLIVSDVDGELRVSDWTGEPLGLFQKGDRILAINDLQTSCMEDFQMYWSKLLKKQVKVTTSSVRS